MNPPKKPQASDYDVSFLANLNDPDFEEPKLPEAGIGLFSHYAEHEEPPLPEAGIGIFDHWLED